MSSNSTPIEKQDFPSDDFAQDSYDDISQDFSDDISQEAGIDFNQDANFDEFAQPEIPEVVKQQKKKR